MNYQSANSTGYRAPDNGGVIRFSPPGDSQYYPLLGRGGGQLSAQDKREFLSIVQDPEWWPEN